MTFLSAFGLFAVTAMLIFYALEKRSAWFVFVFAFALACVLASVYGFSPGRMAFRLCGGGLVGYRAPALVASNAVD